MGGAASGATAFSASRHCIGAGFVLTTLLTAWRVSQWSGPVNLTFAANAALLWTLWSGWSLVLGLVASGISRVTLRTSRVTTWFLLTLAVVAPELLWRAHSVGSQAGWSRSRMGAEWLASSFLVVLLLALGLRFVPDSWLRRRVVVGVVALGLLSLALRVWPQAAGETDARPNVLLIVVDALRADALGCYGNPLAPTPNLDALAASGWRFEHAYSTATTSVPGHASILWGLDAYEHRALSNEYDLPADLPKPLAEELADRGYRTFGVCQNPLVSASSGFGRGFDHYWSWFEPDMAHANALEVLWQFAITRSWFQLSGVEPITQRARARMTGDSPWFGFVQFLYTHDPYRDLDHWATPARVDTLMRRFEDGSLVNRTSYSDREVAELVAQYYGAAHYVDRLVGELVDEARKLDRETLIVVTADHGENLAEHGDDAIAKHFGYYESSLRVPWIVASSARELGRVRGELTGIDRIAPLVLAYVDEGATAAAERVAKSRHFAYSRPLLVAWDDSLKAVVDGSDLTAEPRIFRWREDPLDRHPLPLTSTLCDTLVERQSAIAPLLLDPSAGMRPEKLQRLRALGYIE